MRACEFWRDCLRLSSLRCAQAKKNTSVRRDTFRPEPSRKIVTGVRFYDDKLARSAKINIVFPVELDLQGADSGVLNRRAEASIGAGGGSNPP